MFGNHNGSEKTESHLETVIGAESAFQGTLRSKGSVRIDGKIEGGVSADVFAAWDEVPATWLELPWLTGSGKRWRSPSERARL